MSTKPATRARSAKVDPIPQGYSTITPYLVVRNAAKAIDFYKQAFGAVERSRMAGPNGLLVHAELTIGDSVLMLCDEFPQMERWLSPAALAGTTVALHIYVKDVDASFARAIAAGAKVSMPLMDMFWGDRYGKLTDPFGHEWGLATHNRDVTPEEMEKGAEAFFTEMETEGA